MADHDVPPFKLRTGPWIVPANRIADDVGSSASAVMYVLGEIMPVAVQLAAASTLTETPPGCVPAYSVLELLGAIASASTFPFGRPVFAAFQFAPASMLL